MKMLIRAHTGASWVEVTDGDSLRRAIQTTGWRCSSMRMLESFSKSLNTMRKAGCFLRLRATIAKT